MIAQPRSPQRSTTMPLMLIFIGSLVLIAPAGAVPQDGPPAADGGATACEPVPFVCYARHHLDQLGLHTELPNDGTCEKTCKKCEPEATLTLDETTGRLMIGCDPREWFCNEQDTTADCIKTVKLEQLNKKADNWVIFPRNFCSRMMIANGLCKDKKLVTDIEIAAWKLGTKYVVQCDAGFTIPELLGAVTGSADTIPCVPSLHQFAGLGNDDAKIFGKEDVAPTALTADGQWNSYKWCPAAGSMPANCAPRPLVGSKYYAVPATKQPAKFLLPKSSIYVPACQYRGHHFESSGCAPLDIFDNSKVYTAYRLKSKPYATLLSGEDTLNMTWRTSVGKGNAFAYPRCIAGDKHKLEPHQITLLESNIFLNCATNPYYNNKATTAEEKKTLSVQVEPCKKPDDADTQFCIDVSGFDEKGFEATILRENKKDEKPPAEDESLVIPVSSLAAVVVGGAVALIALVVFKRRLIVARKAEAVDRTESGDYAAGGALEFNAGWHDGWADPLADDHEERMSNYNKPIRRINRFLMQTKSDKDVPETAEVELPPGLLAPVPSPATATDATATQSSSANV